MNETSLWTVPEVAGYLRISEHKVRQLARAGDLPGIKLGHRSWRFRADDVRTYLNHHRPSAFDTTVIFSREFLGRLQGQTLIGNLVDNGSCLPSDQPGGQPVAIVVLQTTRAEAERVAPLVRGIQSTLAA